MQGFNSLNTSLNNQTNQFSMILINKELDKMDGLWPNNSNQYKGLNRAIFNIVSLEYLISKSSKKIKRIFSRGGSLNYI